MCDHAITESHASSEGLAFLSYGLTALVVLGTPVLVAAPGTEGIRDSLWE